ncbi:RWD domain-containing protein 3 [Chanos chanos]|uniref:RWD domain-containing protein 3 n=1 Tax=Chanos chanos TaxID=29144 RepID=A0A6J2VKN7_CHACN|nr:RWD domain-containing protein 3 [Chanos chanos]
MSTEALDEMDVLSSIYCEKDEFELLESAERGLVCRINTVAESGRKKILLSVTFHLPSDYPNSPPDICVSSEDLSRKQCQDVKNNLVDRVRTLAPGPMVHDLVMWLQENFDDIITTSSSSSVQNEQEADVEGTWMALLHLDHMRSKTKYIKLIEKWTSDLELTGRLYTGKLILILLQGARRNIKEYIHLQKTVKVDVDSSGKRCKEKMMSVLCELPLSGHLNQMSSFEVKEIASPEELRGEFEAIGLSHLYQEFVPSLV